MPLKDCPHGFVLVAFGVGTELDETVCRELVAMSGWVRLGVLFANLDPFGPTTLQSSACFYRIFLLKCRRD